VSAGQATSVDALAARVERRRAVLADVLATHHDRIARICHDMARAFARGGVLTAFGSGAAATDAAHVAVEFMHPVVVGKRALPAVALGNDPTGASTLERLGRPDDIALALVHAAADARAEELLASANALGMLTIGLGGAGSRLEADHAIAVPDDDPRVVQEVQETIYHVLWELVHVFFEHPGLLEDVCVTCGDVGVPGEVVVLAEGGAVVDVGGARETVAVDLLDQVAVGDRVLCHAGVALERLEAAQSEETAFLYPFLEAEEDDLERVLADVRASTLRKGEDVTALRAALDLQAVARGAAGVRAALDAGARLLTFGNGGSATDAQDLAADALAAGWPAIALVNDVSTVTAVGNDVGYENVFARQLIALGRAGDVAIGISTSGSSPNVVSALAEAQGRGMRTCAIVGYDGGRLRDVPWLDDLLVSGGDYIPRLQEAHATIYHLLLEAIGTR
jgi:D-sedoheptulose 7-phosphate isomerase